MPKKKLLIIAYNTLHNDPRILRQVKALQNDFDITAAGYSDPGQGIKYIRLEEWTYKMIDFYFNYPLILRKIFALGTMIYLKTGYVFRILTRKILTGSPFNMKGYYFRKDYWVKTKINYNQLKHLDPDVIIANDIATLPLAVKLKHEKTKLVFDAHEYHPEEMTELEEWKLKERPGIIYFCQTFLRKADLMMTVSEPIAKEYKKEFNVDPIVVTNAPAFVNLEPLSVSEKIKLVHHGSAIRQRFLDETINVMNYLDQNYSLDLILVGTDKEYLTELKEKYKNEPRIKFLDPVPTHEISKTINQYDIGIYILPPLNFNNINALPNKFFEFIQGRLMVAIAPMPAMAEIVKKYNLGVVAEDYSSKALAEAIKKLNRQEIYERKKNSEAAAMELSEEVNKKRLLNEIKKLVN